MKKKQITKLSNGEVIDLSRQGKRKLKRLHYEEEKFIAKKILEAPPFSAERMNLMQQGYDLVNDIMPWYLPQVNISYGADEKSVGIVIGLLKGSGKKKLVYEAGVGTGYSCEHFAELPNVSVRGCDIVLCDRVKLLMDKHEKLLVEKDDLYHNLKKLKDNSVDCFYADNVIEHMLPDEFPYILRVLSKKMKKNGLLVLVIPNKLVGPGDVSKYFLKMGENAEGFHFMEMSYRETLAKFKRAGIVPGYFIWLDKENNIRYVKDKKGILNKIKVWAESLICLFIKDADRRKRIFRRMAMSYYILIKK